MVVAQAHAEEESLQSKIALAAAQIAVLVIDLYESSETSD